MNDEEILAIVVRQILVDIEIDIKSTIKLIHSAASPHSLMNELVEYGAIHALINCQGVNEIDLQTFFHEFAQSININALFYDSNTSMLMLLIQKEYSDTLEKIFNGDFVFSHPINFKYVNNRGETAFDIATDPIKPLLDKAIQDDFKEHIVLVQPLQANSIVNCLFATKKESLVAYSHSGEIDPLQTVYNAMVIDDTLLMNNATIGRHLDFEAHQYENSFIDRPHIHWWWNGLFQANSGGDWEDSMVAYIEPLVEVKNVFGCAYYDTMTMGSHKLSDRATIIVPNQLLAGLRARLSEFKGAILGFDPELTPIRKVINEIIRVNYPQSYGLFNQKKDDINKIGLSSGGKRFNHHLASNAGYDTSRGFYSHVSISSKEKDEKPQPLMHGSADIKHPAYQTYSQQRYVGLHVNSPTDVERIPRIQMLGQVSCSPQSIEYNAKYFIPSNNTNFPHELIALDAFKVYKKLMEYSVESGAHNYGNYLMKKALIAEFRSIHNSPPQTKQLSKTQLKQLVESSYPDFIIQLEAIDTLYKPTQKTIYPKLKDQVEDYKKTLTKAYARLSHFQDTKSTFFKAAAEEETVDEKGLASKPKK